jgi:metallothiol transferase
MIKGIANVVFKVSDITRSCDFFEKKLGLKIAYREANWAEVDLNAVHLGLMQAEPAGGARNPFLSLLVDDINATVATLKERGVEFSGDIKDEPFGKLITVNDPDGNQFDLFEAAE